VKPFGTKHIVLSVITFAIIFAMNYVGNDLPDRLSRALMNAAAAVVGLGIGIFILYRAKKDDRPHDDFD